MKNVIQILSFMLLMFFVSCDALDEVVSSVEESEAELTDSYYLEEGWSSMDSQDYSSAIDFFEYLMGIVSSETDLRIQSEHGLAWAKLFFSTTSESENKMNDRTESYDAFFSVETLISQTDSDIDGSKEQIECDLYAGKILYADYMIYYYQNLLLNGGDIDGDEVQQRDYYSQGEQSGNDENGNGHIELGLSALINQLDQNCPEYSTQNYAFDHNMFIEINDLKLILAKDYIRRSEYVNAKNTIIDIMNSIGYTSITFNLNNEAGLDGDKKIIGDFLYKTIGDDDVYTLNLSDDGIYSVTIDLNQVIPCNFSESFDESNESDVSDLRDELFECINGYDYFNSNNNRIFKYRFIDGDYDETIVSNQEAELPSQCSSDDSYRILEVPYNSFSSIIVDPACFNSCSSSCE